MLSRGVTSDDLRVFAEPCNRRDDLLKRHLAPYVQSVERIVGRDGRRSHRTIRRAFPLPSALCVCVWLLRGCFRFVFVLLSFQGPAGDNLKNVVSAHAGLGNHRREEVFHRLFYVAIDDRDMTFIANRDRVILGIQNEHSTLQILGVHVVDERQDLGDARLRHL